MHNKFASPIRHFLYMHEKYTKGEVMQWYYGTGHFQKLAGDKFKKFGDTIQAQKFEKKKVKKWRKKND